MPPTSVRSVDASTYELGVQSAWTRDDAVVTGVEWSESTCAEPPTSGPTDQSGSDHMATDPIEEALDALVEPSTPLVSEDGNGPKNSPEAGDGLGSAEMSLSPPVVPITEHEHLANNYPRMGLFDSLSDAHPHEQSEIANWAEFLDGDEIGDIPKFQTSMLRNAKLVEEQPPPLPRDKSVDKIHYQPALSILPIGSLIKQATTGSMQQHPEPSDSDLSDDDENSSTESDGSKKPESDHDSDTAETKRAKQLTHCKYHAKLNLLKYQQSYIKNDPPFTYNGKANTTTFKKWVREVRDWKD
ncbi:hypothetical protein F4604DRAFT_1687117 [Suillus subluteus]|nr:hypothetical protein F4604DRAFT_1687117 [Suillus subluteus]